MTKFDQYRAYAAECRHLADTSRDQAEKERWLTLADAWLWLLYAPNILGGDQSVVPLHDPDRNGADDLRIVGC
jgi:hypothetical protein